MEYRILIVPNIIIKCAGTINGIFNPSFRATIGNLVHPFPSFPTLIGNPVLAFQFPPLKKNECKQQF